MFNKGEVGGPAERPKGCVNGWDALDAGMRGMRGMRCRIKS